MIGEWTGLRFRARGRRSANWRRSYADGGGPAGQQRAFGQLSNETVVAGVLRIFVEQVVQLRASREGKSRYPQAQH